MKHRKRRKLASHNGLTSEMTKKGSASSGLQKRSPKPTPAWFSQLAKWIRQNIRWMFSGIGVMVLITIFSWVFRKNEKTKVLLTKDDVVQSAESIIVEQPQITWIYPTSGSEVGWKTTVMLESPTNTELVTVLVRPLSGETFYVQGGARPLSTGRPESFAVKLGDGPAQAVGQKFDILAVCSETFRPRQWSLYTSEVPDSSVIGRITVQKIAGTIRLADKDKVEKGLSRVQGQIWTADGGAILVKKGTNFEVLRALRPSIKGNQFDEKLSVAYSDCNAIYLLVYREGTSALQVGQSISEAPTASYWLYELQGSSPR